MKTEKSLTLNAYCFIFSVNIEWSALNGTHAKTDISAFSVNLARKPEGVGVRGQGKVAFSHTLWLPLPRGAEHVAYKGRAASRLIGRFQLAGEAQSVEERSVKNDANSKKSIIFEKMSNILDKM